MTMQAARPVPVPEQRARLPDWAANLSIALESGACGQFVLYGNVHDRSAIGDRFVGIDRFVEDEMLGSTDVILVL
jgi:hypothetical protein